jgi:hypothetical protein
VEGAAMRRLRWIFQQAIDRHGLPAMVGVLVLAVCAVFYTAVVLPLEQRLSASNDTSSLSVGQARREAIGAEDELQRSLRRFYAYFRDRQGLQHYLAVIDSAARTAGISLRRAEYQLVDEPVGTLKQYRVTVPVVDSYPRIKRFVATVLNDVPVASLDSIRLQRGKIGDTTVEGEIQLTIFFPEDT